MVCTLDSQTLSHFLWLALFTRETINRMLSWAMSNKISFGLSAQLAIHQFSIVFLYSQFRLSVFWYMNLQLRIFVVHRRTSEDTYIQTYRQLKKNGTLYFSNKFKTINHIDLILSGIHIHPWPLVSCKFGNNIQRNKVIAMILVKEAKPV